MYQFYYAEQCDRNRPEPSCSVRDRFHIEAIRPAMWEEHCLECSAPACYESCAYYEARSDGRCRRFANSIEQYDCPAALCGKAARVEFRPWADMMTVLFPAMLTPEDYIALTLKNEKPGAFMRRVTNSRLPQGARWFTVRALEYLRRRRLRGLTGLENEPDAFLFHAFSEYAEPFRLIVEFYRENDSVFKLALPVEPGENLAVLPRERLAPACWEAGCVVKVYPENNVPAAVTFFALDFVRGSAVQAEQPAQKVKCVVWDLDNTVWAGTLAETEEPDTLALRPGIREMMEELDRRGILQSAASKNDLDAAMPVLRRLGVADYLLYPQIGWNPKSDGIRAIAGALNIGTDTFAFLDDMPFERNEVKTSLPQVRVYDSADAGAVLHLPEFDVPVTEEGRNRRTMYRAEELRHEAIASAGSDIADFVRGSHMTLELFTPETEEERLRCYELLIRTNQLNMTGRKYSREEYDRLLAQPGLTTAAFSCRDDFGSYGIVGFAQYSAAENAVHFSEFAMSCRAAGKCIESAFFTAILRREHRETGELTVVKTKKNTLLRNTLAGIGFETVREGENDTDYRYGGSLTNNEIVLVTER